MKQNLGNTDRIIRVVLGLAVILVGVYFQTWLGLLGIVLLGTAATSRCPLYVPLRLATCRVEERE